MQKNKFTTYLLYATGEIVLVVFGILIAVSINNWNTKIDNQKLVDSYIVAMKKELEQNIKILDDDIKYIQNHIEKAGAFMEKMKSPSSNVDTLINYARYHYIYEYDPDVSLNFNTFKTLESTGHIALLNTVFRDSLYSFQENQTKFTNLISYNIAFFKNIDTEYHTYYPVSGNDNTISEKMLDHFWERVDKEEFTARFNSVSTNKYITDTHVLKFKYALRHFTVQFLEYLDQQ